MSDLVKRLSTRTEQELEALGEGMDSKPVAPAKTQPPPTTVTPTEQAGIGRDLLDETTRVVLAGIDARLAAARKAGNKQALLALEARRKAVLEQAEAMRNGQ